MPASNSGESARPQPTIFLSYASEDRPAAQRIRDALPSFGLEVWYDESDLVGGDSWDQKIRRQIRECDYFMPVISAHTEARHEGYFRREWRLAVERTLDMADDHVFLLPVVIDGTTEAGARVPDKFRAVQWLKAPDGQPTAALEALCRRLVSGEPAKGSARNPSTAEPPPPRPSQPRGRDFPVFPREEPGQRIRFWFQVAGWGLHSAWIAFSRFPKWVRIGIYCWLAILLLSRGCTSSRSSRDDRDTPPPVPTTQAEKLRHISQAHSGSWTAADTQQLLGQLAKELPAYVASATSARVLAIPFAAPSGNAAAQQVAGSVFSQVYGRLAIASHGHAVLADEPLPTLDESAALQQGLAHHSAYIVYGAVASNGTDLRLTVKILGVEDASAVWSKSYPLTGVDPAGIAQEVSSHIPSQDDD
jgi:TolB-like protein